MPRSRKWRKDQRTLPYWWRVKNKDNKCNTWFELNSFFYKGYIKTLGEVWGLDGSNLFIMIVLSRFSHVWLRAYGLQPARLLHPWDSPGNNTGVGFHFLLQGSTAHLLWLCRGKYHYRIHTQKYSWVTAHYDSSLLSNGLGKKINYTAHATFL